MLPVEIVLAPDWWHAHAGLTFDRDFFFHPARRVEDERKMERVLHARWGRFGLGADRDRDLPLIGATHLAAGFLLSEMLGCRVDYLADRPPQVIPAHRADLAVDAGAAFRSDAFRRFDALCGALRARFGRLAGDVNWGGVLNVALDLRGQDLFIDWAERPDDVRAFFRGIAGVLDRFTASVAAETGTTSISVNRSVRHVDPAIHLHSGCSHTMISAADYERFLLEFDAAWSLRHARYGLHHCGPDAHRFADAYAKIPNLRFLDAGWGSDLAVLRRRLPEAFLNIRLSPAELVKMAPEAIRAAARRLVAAAGGPARAGLCCVNLDATVKDEQVAALFEAADEIRREAVAAVAR
jgi:hypothetical protein